MTADPLDRPVIVNEVNCEDAVEVRPADVLAALDAEQRQAVFAAECEKCGCLDGRPVTRIPSDEKRACPASGGHPSHRFYTEGFWTGVCARCGAQATRQDATALGIE